MGILAGKTAITFGDSIVDGHLYKKAGLMEFVADHEGMIVRKYANNGACIMPGNPIREDGIGGMILTDQVMKAAEHHLISRICFRPYGGVVRTVCDQL